MEEANHWPMQRLWYGTSFVATNSWFIFCSHLGVFTLQVKGKVIFRPSRRCSSLHVIALCNHQPLPHIRPPWMHSVDMLGALLWAQPGRWTDPHPSFVLSLSNALGSNDTCWIFKAGKRGKWAGSCQLLCPQLWPCPPGAWMLLSALPFCVKPGYCFF